MANVPGGHLPPGIPAALELAVNWHLLSSVDVADGGEQVSLPTFPVNGWHPARVPSTVMGTLVEEGLFGDPLQGMALRSLPGMSYPINTNFVSQEMAADSPFRPGWWYQTTFDVGAVAPGQHTWLQLDGVNYDAQVWVNGRRLDDGDVIGTFRAFEFDLTDVLIPNAPNTVAIEVHAPTPGALSQTWVDWNPTPPDKDMGLWRKVSLAASGPYALRHPFVHSQVSADHSLAQVRVEVDVVNTTDAGAAVTVHGSFGDIDFSKDVTLAPNAVQTVIFEPTGSPVLAISNPQLWWPVALGTPALQHLTLELSSGGALSDRALLDFGIREVTSRLNSAGTREFLVNGTKLLIRGAGWARDIFFRDTDERDGLEVDLVKNLGLNAIRFEGTFGAAGLFDRFDREGIVVIPGWSCCDAWQQTETWDADRVHVGEASMRDMALRLRAHPSVITWLYGSDLPPVPPVEDVFLRVLAETHWPNPVQSSATERVTPAGPTGLKMHGPYVWVNSTYWLSDTLDGGGAFGFATEICPGTAIPESDDVREMLQRGDGDTIDPTSDAVWNFHCASENLEDTSQFNDAIRDHFGGWSSFEDYDRKAQVLQYEGERAMFEGYSQHMDITGGVIQWMLTNAWPSLYWHLFDHSLGAAGNYFGAKKALEKIHIQYSQVGDAVFVVNTTPSAEPDLSLNLKWLSLEGTALFETTQPVSVGALSATQVLVLPSVVTRPLLSFLFLELSRAGGAAVSHNTYWLPDTFDPPFWGTGGLTTRVKSADYSPLTTLPRAALEVTSADQGRGQKSIMLTNTSAAPAFFVRLSLTGEVGREVKPVFWSDNYLTLAPGETRVISASWDAGVSPTLRVSSWNAGP